MKEIIEGFEHRTGHHCGSVAMADLLRHAGIELSEAMALGLGSGVAFYYIVSEHLSPTRQVMGRSMTLEEDCADALGLELRAHRADDPEQGWAGVREAIEAGKPALIQCDLSKLPYWRSSTPFNGHKLLAVGFDDVAQTVFVADTHFEGLQEVARADFDAARASVAPPAFDAKQLWWTLESSEPRPMAEAIDRALGRAHRHMSADESGMGGLDALRRFADEVGDWVEQPDAAWCYRYAYQCIEKRGTGGGMFRVLYRDFLREAAAHRPGLASMQLGVAMARAAQAWSTLSDYLEAMSRWLDPERESPAADPTHHVGSLAEAVYQFESAFWDRMELL